MTGQGWNAATARRELDAWRQRWRALGNGDGAEPAGLLAAALIRVTPRHKLATLRACLVFLIDDALRSGADVAADVAGEQVLATFRTPQAPAPVRKSPWRCRLFGHAWRGGRGSVAMYCERGGCLEVRRWPEPPPPPKRRGGTRVGVAIGPVREGELVVALDPPPDPSDVLHPPAKPGEPVCGSPPPPSHPHFRHCARAAGHEPPHVHGAPAGWREPPLYVAPARYHDDESELEP